MTGKNTLESSAVSISIIRTASILKRFINRSLIKRYMLSKLGCVLLILLVACQSPTAEVVHDAEMGASAEIAQKLFVEQASVEKQRDEFVQKLKTTAKNKRPLYEEYIDVIGANGILDGIDKVWPLCHDEAHDLGKVIFAKVKDIGIGLQICADRCYSGCMHGVLMEAFANVQKDGHIDLETVKPKMDEVCKNERMAASYSPGDCAHGVGHALMYLAADNISEAIDACKTFDKYPMKYYCATGAYMQYTLDKEKEDAETKEAMYPCDSFDFPAACARYKLVYVMFRNTRKQLPPSTLIKECEKLSGKFRLGCFHGLGNAYMVYIRDGSVKITDVCLTGTEDEQFVCIEGVIERMAKYFPDKAKVVCDDLEGKNKETCLNAFKQGMYNMDKDFSLYQE